VPAFVNMTDDKTFNTTELLGKIAEAKASIEKVFKSFDKDNSGFIDREELKKAVIQIGVEMNDMDCYNMMLDLDRNQDGKISLEEF
jgi:Ca2+-binding EF-hand superfamily protein